MGYSIPVYHEGKKNSYVDFYAYDPVEDRIRRKKYHLESIAKKRERRDYANRLVSELTMKLAKGWRPWATAKDAPRGYTPIDECLDKYLERIRRSGRPETIHSYTSRVNILRAYMATLDNPPLYICQFNREFVTDYLDWILTERNVGPRTRNNYRNWLTVFAEFLVERRYLAENPVTGTEKLKEKPKHRKPLTPEMLREVTEYLNRTDRNFLLAVMMEYYTFIRPSELSRIRIDDISVASQSVFVAGEISKNGRDYRVALNETIIRLMIDTGCLTARATGSCSARTLSRPRKAAHPTRSTNAGYMCAKNSAGATNISSTA